jgi:hypothetical protein
VTVVFPVVLIAGLISLESPANWGDQLNLASGAVPPELFVDTDDQFPAWASIVQPVGGNVPLKSTLKYDCAINSDGTIKRKSNSFFIRAPLV